MKKILIPISMLFVAGLYHAQATNTENYVQTRVYLEPVTASSSTAKQAQTVQYFDGLGRPKQVVNVKASPLGKDVVSHIEYDGFGRQVKDFLPIPQSGTLNGAIVPNPLANATQPTIYGSEKIYSEKILENSPLDRVFEQKQVGNAWSNKPVKFEYDANSVADAVKKYTTTTTWVSGATNSVLTQTANYGLAQLYKNTVIDEDGNKTIEFKNGEGQTVLVRKMLDGTNSADTYYVYNEYNQLAFVIPPLAVASNNVNITTLNNLCYQYKYDGRNRLVEKKLPGKGWEYMVYDKQDRLVATQDANLASNGQWLFTKYDKFGRVIYTGLAELGSRNSAQTNLDNLSGTAAPNNEAKSTSSFNHSGMDIYYSNSAFPTNIIKILSVNYYDTYPTGSPAIPTQVLGQNVLPQDAQNSNISTKSLPVASYVKNIEDDNWTKNYTWYDTKGRAIGSHSINHLGGFTKTESELDFAGVVKKTNTYHSRSSQSTEVTVKENFTYDPQNRLVTHTHQVNGNPVEILAENTYNELGQLIYKNIGGGLQSAEYDYNIRGWMTGINKNNLSPNGMGSKLFAYDIRYENPTESGISHTKFNGNISEVNWMVSSNQTHKRYVYNYDKLNRLTAAIFLNPNSTTPLNHMNDEIVDYDLNGNITYLMRNAAPFAGTTPDMIDDLIYTYNGNQLLQIQDDSNNPTGYEGGGGWIDYDANGNMLNMPDKQINQIGYNFLNLPNALKIEDSKKKLFHLYRADGSKLKKIFNYLKDDGNNFTTVTEYLDGFQYLTTMGTKPNDIDPMEFAYEQEAFLEQILEEKPTTALQFFPTAEGFYDYENNQYIYQYKDHLGNARVSYKKGVNGLAEITDQNDYYPFGMNIPREEKAIFGVASLYNYKYNGKELQETGMYDFGARFYMPDIGRWGVVDPAAELGRRWSPYTYAFDNPVMFIDPDGMWPWPTWSQVKSFGRGAWNTTVGMVKGLATSNGISGVMQGGREFKKVYNAYQTGGAKAAVKQYGKSLYETSGAKAIVQTAKGVAKGDAESIGSATVMVAAAVITRKAAGGKAGKAAPAAEAETTTLHRGVNSTSPAYSQAVEGTATPRGGNATPLEHNTVTTESNYTSWTTNASVAENFALRTSGEGVVLTADIPNSQLVQSPNLKSVNLVQSPGTIVSESETLVKGPVTGADVKKVNLER
ncbi:hypothetical protein CHRY9390_01348 [Chryseobacterium aquaeductus]|uniref:DUF6443 domain-containing protein n=1 Tax=Chryseobacterium aquaeductus TaxID=2675056 RepID=A0A9N8MGG0_9FLAO|nr:DUF6443 domain-containing protein [Chryseobacterium aquaeductus]CAA7330677.1 hypothetical protein CHRY9390_01348 [Chryseobacterium potabilaquae]CAD7805311.1 hypothetical protein CHRY9390_01348 [Chryseobacterium aquaeductus]